MIGIYEDRLYRPGRGIEARLLLHGVSVASFYADTEDVARAMAAKYAEYDELKHKLREATVENQRLRDEIETAADEPKPEEPVESEGIAPETAYIKASPRARGLVAQENIELADVLKFVGGNETYHVGINDVKKYLKAQEPQA